MSNYISRRCRPGPRRGAPFQTRFKIIAVSQAAKQQFAREFSQSDSIRGLQAERRDAFQHGCCLFFAPRGLFSGVRTPLLIDWRDNNRDSVTGPVAD